MARTQYQVIADPLPIPLFPVVIDNSAEVIFTREFQYDATVIGSPPILPSFGYFQPFSEPVRKKPMLATGDQEDFWPGFLPVIPSFGYFDALSEPTRRRPAPILTGQQEDLFSGFPPIIPSFGYYSQFKDLIRARPNIGVMFNAALFNPLPPENITLDKWYQNFVPLPNEAFTVSESVIDFVIQLPETITVDKWFQELSKPQLLYKPFLQSSAQDFVAFTELIPEVTQDWFYYAFSEPVRFKPRLIEALQFYQEGYVYNPNLVTFQDIRWFTALSEPVRYLWFPPAEQQSLLALTLPFGPPISYADVIVQTWNVLPEIDTWIINLDLTGCDCGD